MFRDLCTNRPLISVDEIFISFGLITLRTINVPNTRYVSGVDNETPLNCFGVDNEDPLYLCPNVRTFGKCRRKVVEFMLNVSVIYSRKRL